MEKRVIVAAMLMAGLLMLYQTFFLSPSTQHPQPTKTETPAKPAPGAASTAPATAPGGSSAAAPAPVAAPAIPERAAEIVSPLYRATVSSRGGELREWELNYRGQKPLVIPACSGPPVSWSSAPAPLLRSFRSSSRPSAWSS
jgi:YidC/Oxa1 family membrane protein insertase